ncbi:MAG TPA: sigma factor-like helix-turn-helix DNA-binding protein, partial [Hyphomicrobiaceae bacterium]|nr:sigma factor-like helix-turn-helix DNA-binding protein [Hyphomicrobiaceae bacterium]
ALARLAPDQREALIHVTMLGHSYEEAAEMLGCAVGTIKSRVNRGRARLTQVLYGRPAVDEQTAIDRLAG